MRVGPAEGGLNKVEAGRHDATRRLIGTRATSRPTLRSRSSRRGEAKGAFNIFVVRGEEERRRDATKERVKKRARSPR